MSTLCLRLSKTIVLGMVHTRVRNTCIRFFIRAQVAVRSGVAFSEWYTVLNDQKTFRLNASGDGLWALSVLSPSSTCRRTQRGLRGAWRLFPLVGFGTCEEQTSSSSLAPHARSPSFLAHLPRRFFEYTDTYVYITTRNRRQRAR